MGTTLRAETKTWRWKSRVKYWLHDLKYRLLNDSICNSRYTQLSFPSTWLRYHNLAHWLRLIASIQQRLDKLLFVIARDLQKIIDSHPVNTWRAFICFDTLVCLVEIRSIDDLLHQVCCQGAWVLFRRTWLLSLKHTSASSTFTSVAVGDTVSSDHNSTTPQFTRTKSWSLDFVSSGLPLNGSNSRYYALCWLLAPHLFPSLKT